MSPPCPRCATVYKTYGTAASVLNGHVCTTVDVEMSEAIARSFGRAPSFKEAQQIHQRISRNLVGAEAHVQMHRIPSAPAEFLAYVRVIHGLILEGTRLRFAGVFRDIPVSFGPESRTRQGAAPDQIAPQLERLCSRSIPVSFANQTPASLAGIGAQLVYEFLEIHPFEDVNGRTARMLFRAIVLSTDRYEMRHVDERGEERDGYLAALQAIDRHIEDSERGSPYEPLARWYEKLIVEGSVDEEAPSESE